MSTNYDELTYYSKMLTKIKYKKYEFYVISRIIHLLNDFEIQFTTQQIVKKPDGRRYLIDLYFPQFKLAIEIDESHHLSQEEADKYREKEVTHLLNTKFERINCTKNASFESVNHQIDQLVNKIKVLKQNSKTFVPYSYRQEYSVKKWIENGVIHIMDTAKFRTHVDVLKLFGKEVKSHQRATFLLREDLQLWFPKLYPNADWINTISSDGSIIEQTKSNGYMEVKDIKNSIVFAHFKDVLGNTYYVFKGIFRCVDNTPKKIIYERIANEIDLSDFL